MKGNSIWYKNLYEPLLDIGIEVDLFIIDEEKKRNNINDIDNYLYDAVCKSNTMKKVDLFLSYIRNDDLEINTIKRIKELGIPTANFSCNNTHQFYLTKEIAPYFDFNLHSEKHAAGMFKEINANPVWFQMAANPKYYHPIDVAKSNDVSFVGMRYAKRAYYMNILLDNDINVMIYGPHWVMSSKELLYSEIKRFGCLFLDSLTWNKKKRDYYSSKLHDYDFYKNMYRKYSKNFHLPVDDDDMIFIFNRTRLNFGSLEVFGVDNCPNTIPKMHLHLREFEVPMTCNAYITNYSDELAEFYEPEKEIITYKNEYELLEKTRYYLKNEKALNEIAKKGYERAMKCHTYQNRYKDLFKNIGIYE